MSINDGGPAFPQVHRLQDAQGQPRIPELPGMSLRDWFAGQAMAAFIKRAVSADDWSRLGSASYEAADAMLAARNSTQPKET